MIVQELSNKAMSPARNAFIFKLSQNPHPDVYQLWFNIHQLIFLCNSKHKSAQDCPVMAVEEVPININS
ncbi:unnamed protein product [Linum trigynum]|uniref:Uncharacterized protein n=1 Tax=Linum trigynum TaxID=586398 RepID=A0AAV2CG74_9ROSI